MFPHMFPHNSGRLNRTCFYRQGLFHSKNLLHAGHRDTESQNQIFCIFSTVLSSSKVGYNTDVMPWHPLYLSRSAGTQEDDICVFCLLFVPCRHYHVPHSTCACCMVFCCAFSPSFCVAWNKSEICICVCNHISWHWSGVCDLCL